MLIGALSLLATLSSVGVTDCRAPWAPKWSDVHRLDARVSDIESDAALVGATPTTLYVVSHRATREITNQQGDVVVQVERKPDGMLGAVHNIGFPKTDFETMPVGITDSDGRLHLLWGRKAATGYVPTDVMHATFDGNTWSEPERVARFEHMDWAREFISQIVRTSDGFVLALGASSNDQGGAVELLRWRKTGWTVTHRAIGGPFGPAYIDAAISARGTMALVFFAADSHVAGTRATQIITSSDGGVTLSAPRVIRSDGTATYGLRVAYLSGEKLAMIWTPGGREVHFSGQFAYSESSGDLSTWSAPLLLPNIDAARDPKLFVRCGRLHVLFEDAAHVGVLTYVTVTAAGWTKPVRLFAGMYTWSSAIAPAPRDCMIALFTAIPVDSMPTIAGQNWPRPKRSYALACDPRGD